MEKDVFIFHWQYYVVLYITFISRQEECDIRQYKTGILDNDETYMFRMMNYINSDINNPLLAIAFSSQEKLEEYLTKSKLDALILPDGMYEQIINANSEAINTDSMVIIRISSDETDADCIYKYLRADLIICDIVGRLENDRQPAGLKLRKTVGVISHTGRCGRTNLALALCMDDEVRGGLYIGMEEYGGLLSEGADETDKTLKDVSNLWYLVKNRSAFFSEKLRQTVVHRSNIDILNSPVSYIDIRNITASDIRWLLEQIKSMGEYTTVVFDIGAAVCSDWTILECFDWIIMAEPDKDIYQIRSRSFDRMLIQQELGKISCQIKHVQVPDVSYDSPEMTVWIEKMRKKGMIYE